MSVPGHIRIGGQTYKAGVVETPADTCAARAWLPTENTELSCDLDVHTAGEPHHDPESGDYWQEDPEGEK